MSSAARLPCLPWRGSRLCQSDALLINGSGGGFTVTDPSARAITRSHRRGEGGFEQQILVFLQF